MSSVNTQPSQANPFVAQIQNSTKLINDDLKKLQGRTFWKFRISNKDKEVENIKKNAKLINECIAKLKTDNVLLSAPDLNAVFDNCEAAAKSISELKKGLVNDKPTKMGFFWLIESVVRTFGWAIGLRSPDVENINMQDLSPVFKASTGSDMPAPSALPSMYKSAQKSSGNSIQDVVGTRALLELSKGPAGASLKLLEATLAKSGLNDYINPSLLANISIPNSAFLYRESGTKFILVSQGADDIDKKEVSIEITKDGKITKTDSSRSLEISHAELQSLLSEKPIASSSAIKKAIMAEESKSIDRSDQSAVNTALSETMNKKEALIGQPIYTKLWKDSKGDIYLSRIDAKGKTDHLKVDISLQGAGGFTAINPRGWSSAIIGIAQSPAALASACGVPVEQFQERLELEKRLKGHSEAKTVAEITVDARYVIKMGRTCKHVLPPFVDAIGKDDKGVLQVFRFNTTQEDLSNLQAQVIPLSTSTLDPRGKFAIEGAEPLPELLSRVEAFARSVELETRKANRPIVDFVKEEARDSASLKEGLKRFFPNSGQDKTWCIIKNEGVGKWVQNAAAKAIDFFSVGYLSINSIPTYALQMGDKSIPIEIGKDKITLKFQAGGLNGNDVVCTSIAELKKAVNSYTAFDEFAQKYDRGVSLRDQTLKNRFPFSEFNIENQLKSARLVLGDKCKDFAGICGLSIDSEALIKPSYVFNYIDRNGAVQQAKITVTDLGWSVHGRVHLSLNDFLKSISMEQLTFKSIQNPDFVAKVSGTSAIQQALHDPQLSRGYATDQTHIEQELRNVAAKLGNDAAKGIYRVWSDNKNQYQLTRLEKDGKTFQTFNIVLDDSRGLFTINNISYDVKKLGWLDNIEKALGLISSKEEGARTQSLKELMSFVGAPVKEEDEKLVQHKAQMLALISPGLLDGFSYLKQAPENKSFIVVSYDKEGKFKESPVDLSMVRAGDSTGDVKQKTITSFTTELGIKKGKNDIDTVIMSAQGVFQGNCTTKSAAELHVAKIFEGLPDVGVTWMLRWPAAPASWNPFTIIRRMFYTELALNPSLTIVERTFDKDGNVQMVSHDFSIEPQDDGSLKIFDENRNEKGTCRPEGLKEFIAKSVSNWVTNKEVPFLGSIEDAAKRVTTMKDFEDSIVFQPTDKELLGDYRPTLTSKNTGFHLDFKKKGQSSLPLEITRTVGSDGAIKYKMSCSQQGVGNVQTEEISVSADQLKDGVRFKKWIKEQAVKFYSAMPAVAQSNSVSQPAPRARAQQTPSSEVQSKLKPLPQVEIVSARKQQTIDEIQKNKAAEDARLAQIAQVAQVAQVSPKQQQLLSDGSVLIGTRNQISVMLKGMFFEDADDSCVEKVLDSLEVAKQGVLTLNFYDLAAELCSELDLAGTEPPIDFNPDGYELSSPEESLSQFLTEYVDVMRQDLKTQNVSPNQAITKNISAGIVKKPEIDQKANPKSLNDVLELFGQNSEEQGIHLRKFMQYQIPKVAVSVCKAAGITTVQSPTPNEFVCKLLPIIAEKNPEVFAILMARDCITIDPSIQKGNEIKSKILGDSVRAMGAALEKLKSNSAACERFKKTFESCQKAYNGKDKDVNLSLQDTLEFLEGKKALKDLWPSYF